MPIDERPRCEAIKERWRQSSVWLKELNENLAPLMRFLRGKIGRPWDEVYSEICERINRDSAVQLHIWQHVRQAVLTDPRKIEEWKIRARDFRVRGLMYVDPETGRFCELKSPIVKRDVRARRATIPWLTIVEGRYYRKIEGLWYEVELAPLPVERRPGWDAVMRKLTSCVSRGELQKAYGQCVYAGGDRATRFRSLKRTLRAVVTLGEDSGDRRICVVTFVFVRCQILQSPRLHQDDLSPGMRVRRRDGRMRGEVCGMLWQP